MKEKEKFNKLDLSYMIIGLENFLYWDKNCIIDSLYGPSGIKGINQNLFTNLKNFLTMVRNDDIIILNKSKLLEDLQFGEIDYYYLKNQKVYESDFHINTKVIVDENLLKDLSVDEKETLIKNAQEKLRRDFIEYLMVKYGVIKY